jgi:hypothetical protein
MMRKNVRQITIATFRVGAVLRAVAKLLPCAFWCLLGTLSPAQETPSPPPKAAESYPPGPDPKRLFRLESESSLMDRMIQDSKSGENPLDLKYTFVHPGYPSVTKEKYEFRRWEPLTELVEPPYVCYRRLYFEQINSERYGWSLGLGQPVLSAGIFFWDVAWLPYHAFTEPLRRYECNAGYYLPGDPVPLMLYPLKLNLTGALAEAAVIGLGFAIFP